VSVSEYTRNLPPVRVARARRDPLALGLWVALLIAAECAAVAVLILAGLAAP
jgi:hypothetical protein